MSLGGAWSFPESCGISRSGTGPDRWKLILPAAFALTTVLLVGLVGFGQPDGPLR